MSDLVDIDYTTWENTKVIFDCGTASGKTYFILHMLIPYAIANKKRVLYLCNRRPLYDELFQDMKQFYNVDLVLYQILQEWIKQGKTIPRYDYIIADECHYLYTDATFNEYTDLSYKYLIEQVRNVVIFMSATATSFFENLKNNKIVPIKNVYVMPKDYSYVENVYFYKANDLVNVIDDIIQKHPEDKILVFVNGMERLQEMHDIYGGVAYFMCSKTTTEKDVLSFCTNDCVVQYNKEYITFDRKILFATKALDNGINIKDRTIKHVFNEIFDVDSAIQAIGRKRSIDETDKCNFYFKEYGKRGIARFLDANERQFLSVEKYLANKDKFIHQLKEGDEDIRAFARDNRIMYTDWEENEQIKVNTIRYQKYKMDNFIMCQMKEYTYNFVLLRYLGDELSAKVKELEIITSSKDIFLEYLKKICGKKLFKEGQVELKEKMKNLLGLNDRTMGLGVCRGKLSDCQYPYTLAKPKRELSRKSPYFKKTYWMVVPVEDNDKPP